MTRMAPGLVWKIVSTSSPMCPTTSTGQRWHGEPSYLSLLLRPSLTCYSVPRFHHGSLIIGGGNDPATDGSKLALATSSIVAVIQYRLGVVSLRRSSLSHRVHFVDFKQFGWLNPASSSSASNLGVRDAILALSILKQILPHVGGGSVTIGGYSSGAMLVRALVASPSANNLYTKAIMLSDVGVSLHSIFILIIDLTRHFAGVRLLQRVNAYNPAK